MDKIEMHREFEVGGQTYIVSHPDPETAYHIGMEILKIIGEPFAAMAQAAGSVEKSAEALPMAVRTLMAKLDSKDTFAIMMKVFKHVELQGPGKAFLTKAVVDLHFKGRTGSMVNVFSEAVAFQQEDFFSAIGDGVATMMKKALGNEAA